MSLNNSFSEGHCLHQLSSSWKNYAGFFGEPTSTINWCERDYQHSYYIAETYNTVSNAWYIVFACLAAWQLRFHFYPKLFAIQNRDRKKPVEATGGINGELIRFYAVCLGLALVGVGSWCFHMTLTVQHQMFDEIAMHLPIICHIYGLLNMRDYTKVDISKKEKRWFMFLSPFHFVSAISSLVLLSGLLWIYDVRNQALFESVFFFEVLFCFIASFQFAYEQAPGNRAAERHKKAKVQLLWTIFVSLVTGFGVWNIDSHFCSPFVDQFKLHSFWHLFTAYGVYLNIIWLVFSYYSLKSEWIAKKQDHPSKVHSTSHSYSLKWNYLFIPSIEFEECKYE